MEPIVLCVLRKQPEDSNFYTFTYHTVSHIMYDNLDTFSANVSKKIYFPYELGGISKDSMFSVGSLEPLSCFSE